MPSAQQLRDAIAALKGQSPRPKIAPSRLPQSDPSARDPAAKARGWAATLRQRTAEAQAARHADAMPA